MTAAALGLMMTTGVPLVGCTVHTVDTRPVGPLELPEEFAESGEADEAEAPGRWWESFQDPTLDALVERALQDNLDVRAAWGRLRQAHAIARQAGSAMYPTLDAEFRAARQQFVVPIQGQATTVSTNIFNASLPVSYELDVWGRLRHAGAAAREDALAARYEVAAAAMTIASNVTEQWLSVLEQRENRRLLEAQREVNRTFYELVMLRFRQGDAGAAEVLQQQQQLQGLEAELAGLDAQETTADLQLAALLGRGSARMLPEGRDTLPALPPLPPAGLPSALLRRRPDVRAAERRVVAADHRIGEAIAARYPAFRLQASVGFQAVDLAELFDNFIWTLAGSVGANLFDGGRRAAEVERTRGVLEERLANYGQALLRSLGEVEGALAQSRQEQLVIAQLEAQVTTAKATLDAARLRYQQGLSDFLPVLTALRSMQSAEQGLLAARRRQLSQRVQLARALGGTWAETLEPPRRRERPTEGEPR